MGYLAKEGKHFVEFAIPFVLAERLLGMCILVEELLQCGETHLNACVKLAIISSTTSVGIARTGTGIAAAVAATAARCVAADAASAGSAAQLAHNIHTSGVYLLIVGVVIFVVCYFQTGIAQNKLNYLSG